MEFDPLPGAETVNGRRADRCFFSSASTCIPFRGTPDEEIRSITLLTPRDLP